MAKEKPVLINLLATARYQHMPDYPIQFMTTGTLHLGDRDDAVLEYTESEPDYAGHGEKPRHHDPEGRMLQHDGVRAGPAV